jgi:biotin carboxyl carrier protein
MHYDLTICDETSRVESEPPGEGKEIEFNVGGRMYRVLYRNLSENHFHLSVEGRGKEVFVVRGREGKHVFFNGNSFLVKDRDRTPGSSRNRRPLEESPGEITPPMPSVVVRILVREGQKIEKGEGAVVLSAMKMETTLVAPRSGRVEKINTSLGAKVAPGEILVEIREEEAAENG